MNRNIRGMYVPSDMYLSPAQVRHLHNERSDGIAANAPAIEMAARGKVRPTSNRKPAFSEIPIRRVLIDPEKGEYKAQACAIEQLTSGLSATPPGI